MKNQFYLILSILLSIGLLSLFFFFKSQDYLFMDLDVKWILVAGLPVLVVLLLGGYIKSFKGFGVELEANLAEPLPPSLVSIPTYVPQQSLTKASMAYLFSMSDHSKLTITMLRMESGKKGYYDPMAVMEYLKALPNVSYIEVVNHKKEFQYLIPAGYYRTSYDDGRAAINQLISMLESVSLEFPWVIKRYVSADDDLFTVYEQLLEVVGDTGDPGVQVMLPVLTKNKHLLGLVYKQTVEAKIAEEVWRTKRKTG